MQIPKHSHITKNTHLLGCVQFAFGGWLGIRTPDSFHYAGFQDRCFRPLSQPSKYKSHHDG